jgi:hypothetical protein
VWEVIGAVTSSTSDSVEAAARARAQAGRAAARIRARCGELPAAVRRYVRQVHGLTAAPLDDRRLDLVLGAYLQWARTAGTESDVTRLVRGLADCRAFQKEMGVSHRIWWRWTETGKAWWIELTFDNRTGRPWYGSTSGTVRVTGFLPDALDLGAVPPPSAPGGIETAHWGGSSADSLFPRRGVSRQLVAPGADPYVHTTANGRLEVTDVVVAFYPNKEEAECLVPVPERS